MIRTSLWALAILGAVLLLQTTVLGYTAVFGVKPNLLLLVFVILAAQNGSFVSQLVGFALGLVMDMVTTGPLGFHAFLYSLAGYLFGLGKGKVYFDPLVMPVFLGFLATVYELFTSFLLNTVFQLGQPVTAYFHMGALIQVVFNLVVSPVVFWLFGWVKERFQNPRRGFGG